MKDLQGNALASPAWSEMPSGVIPVLTLVVPFADIPQGLASALTARTHEKAALLAMEADLLQALRPEIERLATEVVRNSVREVWQKRSHGVE